ncbi:MAG: ATP-binding protein [Bacteroidales bacterium]|nr:ATP-binding protein [Bacteroidales bacterium]
MFHRIQSGLLLLSVLLTAGCSKMSDSSGGSLSLSAKKELFDSLTIIESKVNLFRNIDSRKSILFAKRGLSLKRINEYPQAFIRANIILGSAFISEKTDSGFFYLEEAMKASDIFGINKFKQEIYYNLSKIYSESMDYKMAIIYLDSVLRTPITSPNYELVANTYNDLGVIKFNLHDYNDAKRLFDTSFRIATSHSLNKQIGVALGNLARFEKNSLIAINTLKKALSFFQKTIGAEEAIAQLKINIGNRCVDSDSAILYYKSAINSVDSGSSNEVLLIAYNNLTYGYIDRKEFDIAENCLVRKAIPLAEKWNNFDWLATLYDTYSDLLLSENKAKEAAIAEKKAYKFRETAYDLKVTGQLRLLALLLDVKNKELHIQSEDQVIQSKSTRIRFLLVIVGLFPVVLGLLWIWGHQRNKLLIERQRLSSANKILKLDETFRSRMAMELHDMTSPAYTSMLRQIEDMIISEPNIKDELIKNLKELSEKIRNISHKMAGSFFENLSIGQLVEGLCHEMQYRTEAQIQLQMEKETIPISGERTHHVIRIIQELLSNGVKYVKQGEIRLILSVELNNLNIIYHDNGTGFSPDRVQGSGLGLISIVERANLIQGKAFLRSEQGKGTHWTIRIPLD